MIAIWNCDTKDIDRCYKKDKKKCDELISNFQNKTKNVENYEHYEITTIKMVLNP